MLTFLFQTTVDIRTQFNGLGAYVSPLAGPGTNSGAALGFIISRVINAGILLSAIMVLIYLVWAGIGWLTAGGDKTRIEAARDRITNAIIGMALVAASFAIYKVVDHFFGIGNAGGVSTSSSSGGSGGSSTATCGGGLAIGDNGNLGGVNYTCVPANTPCGRGNPTGFNYQFNCPTHLVGSTTL